MRYVISFLIFMPFLAIAEEKTPPDLSLFRLDVEDGFALHPWLYHEVRLSKHWGILGDVHVQAPGLNNRFPPFAEVDLGPVLHVAGLQVNPQIGFDIEWRDDPEGGWSRFRPFIPQLYLLYSAWRINAESWNLYFIPFRSDEEQFYLMRQLFTVRVVSALSLGPHIEATIYKRGTNPVDRFAMGGDLSYAFPWGQLTLYLADELIRDVPEFRLTFIREL
jgi:hypothetical protein